MITEKECQSSHFTVEQDPESTLWSVQKPITTFKEAVEIYLLMRVVIQNGIE